MASKNELIEIRMKLLGAKEVAEGSGVAAKGVEKVGKASKKTTTESSKAAKANSVLTRTYGKLGHAAKIGFGVIGVTGVFALEQAVHNTEELSKTTTGLNRNLNIGTSEASKFAAVAYGRGIASTQLNMAFTKLGKTFVEANRKGGTARTGLNQLGIGMAETEKGAHNFNYALELTAQRFGEAEGGPKRQAAALSLLGKGYATVLPMFSHGAKGLKEQEHWADEYGVTLSGKTNKGLMEMVEAQRESKVAMLGLQVSLTRALMPAIEAGEGELQKFIKTLNDPKMNASEKIAAIQRQFEGIENKLMGVITDALPKIAEKGGELGIKLAGAVATGFLHSNLLGKLIIAAWVWNAFGGESLIKLTARKVGGQIGTEVALGIGTGLLGAYLLYEIWEHLDRRTQGAVVRWAVNAGTNFGNTFIRLAAHIIEGLNEELDAHSFGLAPDIPVPGEIAGPSPNRFGEGHGTGTHGTGAPHGGRGRSNAQKRKAYETLWGQPPPPGPPPWAPPKNLSGGRTEDALWGNGKPKTRTRGAHDGSTGRGRADLHVHVEVDRKEIAHAVVRGAQDEAAFG